MAIINFMGYWNEVAISTLMLTDANLRTINIGVLMTNTQTGIMNYSYVFALLVLSAVPNFIFFTIFQKSIIGGISLGGVKDKPLWKKGIGVHENKADESGADRCTADSDNIRHRRDPFCSRRSRPATPYVYIPVKDRPMPPATAGQPSRKTFSTLHRRHRRLRQQNPCCCRTMVTR